MNNLKQYIILFCLSIVSLFFVNVVQADVLDIDGATIDVNGTIISTQISERYIYVGVNLQCNC
jgi:hypothetical protein